MYFKFRRANISIDVQYTRVYTQCPGVELSHPVPGGYKYGNLALSMVTGSARLGPLSHYTANCRRVLTANFKQQYTDRK
jgi:hypothetical protein